MILRSMFATPFDFPEWLPGMLRNIARAEAFSVHYKGSLKTLVTVCRELGNTRKIF
jgi:hypothetical protein